MHNLQTEEFAEDPLASLLCDCSILVPSSEVQLRSSQDQEGLPGKTQQALVPLLSSLEVHASLLALNSDQVMLFFVCWKIASSAGVLSLGLKRPLVRALPFRVLRERRRLVNIIKYIKHVLPVKISGKFCDCTDVIGLTVRFESAAVNVAATTQR